MFDAFLAYLLISLLLLLSGIRIFFLRIPRIDSLAALPPVALILSILTLFIWGTSFFSIAFISLSFLFTVTNLRATAKLAEGLIIDHYHIVFSLITFLELIILGLLIGATIYFRPVKTSPADFGITKQVDTFYGSAISGIHQREGFFANSRISGYITTYSKSPDQKIPQRFIHEEIDFQKKLAELKAELKEENNKQKENQSEGPSVENQEKALADQTQAQQTDSQLNTEKAGEDPKPAAASQESLPTVENIQASQPHPQSQTKPENPSQTGPVSESQPVTESLSQTESQTASTPASTPDQEEGDDEMEIDQKNLPILVFLANPQATTENYEPYLMLLAQKGFTVVSADFYSHDSQIFSDLRDKRLFRRFASIWKLTFTKDSPEFLQIIRNISKRNYDSFIKFILHKYGKDQKIFLITDLLTLDDIHALRYKYRDNTCGVFVLNQVSEYTSSGYGFPEQTDLILARKLGLKRDKTLFIPRYVANKTIKEIKKRIKKPEEESAPAEKEENTHDPKGTEQVL